MSGLQLLDQQLNVSGNDFLGGLCLRAGGDGCDGNGILCGVCMTCSFGLCLGWLGIVLSINAERLLAKAEGSKCKERGITQPLEQSGKGRSAAQGCTER